MHRTAPMTKNYLVQKCQQGHCWKTLVVQRRASTVRDPCTDLNHFSLQARDVPSITWRRKSPVPGSTFLSKENESGCSVRGKRCHQGATLSTPHHPLRCLLTPPAPSWRLFPSQMNPLVECLPANNAYLKNNGRNRGCQTKLSISSRKAAGGGRNAPLPRRTSCRLPAPSYTGSARVPHVVPAASPPSYQG